MDNLNKSYSVNKSGIVTTFTNVNARPQLLIALAGTFVASLSISLLMEDGTTQVASILKRDGSSKSTSISSVGQYVVNFDGDVKVASLQVDSYTSGTIGLNVSQPYTLVQVADSSSIPQVTIGGQGHMIIDDMPDLVAPEATGETFGSVVAGSDRLMGDRGLITWQVDGTFVATAILEARVDASAPYRQITFIKEDGSSANSFNAVGIYRVNLTGMYSYRFRSTAYTSGSMVIRKISESQSDLFMNPQILTLSQILAAFAGADGVANPTMGALGAFSQLFNGTTWDRARSNVNGTTGDTGAKTATGNGATQTNYNAKSAFLTFNIGAVSGTTPTLQFKLQNSYDNGTTWADIPGAVSASITSSGLYTLQIGPGLVEVANSKVTGILGRTWRVVWTIGGTSPSFTITAIGVNYN